VAAQFCQKSVHPAYCWFLISCKKLKIIRFKYVQQLDSRVPLGSAQRNRYCVTDGHHLRGRHGESSGRKDMGIKKKAIVYTCKLAYAYDYCNANTSVQRLDLVYFFPIIFDYGKDSNLVIYLLKHLNLIARIITALYDNRLLPAESRRKFRRRTINILAPHAISPGRKKSSSTLTSGGHEWSIYSYKSD
jgi:hypothetical protein